MRTLSTKPAKGRDHLHHQLLLQFQKMFTNKNKLFSSHQKKRATLRYNPKKMNKKNRNKRVNISRKRRIALYLKKINNLESKENNKNPNNKA
jgi:hypothetical protein